MNGKNCYEYMYPLGVGSQNGENKYNTHIKPLIEGMTLPRDPKDKVQTDTERKTNSRRRVRAGGGERIEAMLSAAQKNKKNKIMKSRGILAKTELITTLIDEEYDRVMKKAAKKK